MSRWFIVQAGAALGSTLMNLVLLRSVTLHILSPGWATRPVCMLPCVLCITDVQVSASSLMTSSNRPSRPLSAVVGRDMVHSHIFFYLSLSLSFFCWAPVFMWLTPSTCKIRNTWHLTCCVPQLVFLGWRVSYIMLRAVLWCGRCDGWPRIRPIRGASWTWETSGWYSLTTHSDTTARGTKRRSAAGLYKVE